MLFGEIGDNQQEEEAARSRHRGRFAEWCVKYYSARELAALLQTMVPANLGQRRAISEAHRDAIAVVADAVFTKSGAHIAVDLRVAFRRLMDCHAATAFRPTLERFAAAPMNATQATSVLEGILTDSKARADASGPNAPIMESLVRRKSMPFLSWSLLFIVIVVSAVQSITVVTRSHHLLPIHQSHYEKGACRSSDLQQPRRLSRGICPRRRILVSRKLRSSRSSEEHRKRLRLSPLADTRPALRQPGPSRSIYAVITRTFRGGATPHALLRAARAAVRTSP